MLRRPLEDGETRAERNGRLVQAYSTWTDLSNRTIYFRYFVPDLVLRPSDITRAVMSTDDAKTLG